MGLIESAEKAASRTIFQKDPIVDVPFLCPQRQGVLFPQPGEKIHATIRMKNGGVLVQAALLAKNLGSLSGDVVMVLPLMKDMGNCGAEKILTVVADGFTPRYEYLTSGQKDELRKIMQRIPGYADYYQDGYFLPSADHLLQLIFRSYIDSGSYTQWRQYIFDHKFDATRTIMTFIEKFATHRQALLSPFSSQMVDVLNWFTNGTVTYSLLEPSELANNEQRVCAMTVLQTGDVNAASLADIETGVLRQPPEQFIIGENERIRQLRRSGISDEELFMAQVDKVKRGCTCIPSPARDEVRRSFRRWPIRMFTLVPGDKFLVATDGALNPVRGSTASESVLDLKSRLDLANFYLSADFRVFGQKPPHVDSGTGNLPDDAAVVVLEFF